MRIIVPSPLDFFEGFAAIPFYRVGHGGLEAIQLGGRTPADVVMLLAGKLHGTLPGPCPIHHADVFVSVGDAMDVQKTRRNQCARARLGGGRAFAQKFHVQAAFLPGFAERGNFRVFIKLDVPAKGQPFVESAMMDEQDFTVADDEDHDGEINFFVDVRHINVI
jgi:hypothetical protein